MKLEIEDKEILLLALKCLEYGRTDLKPTIEKLRGKLK